MNLSDLPPAIQTANPHLFPPVPAPVQPAASEIPEDDFLAQAEAMMWKAGFLSMTPDNFRAVQRREKTCRGFYGHLQHCEGNPQMPDLFAFAWPQPHAPFLCELKSRPVYQPGQKEAIGIRFWKLACNMLEFSLHWECWLKESRRKD
mgnify:CR=1 FL=1